MTVYKVFIVMKITAHSEQDAMDKAVGEMVESDEVQNAELMK